MKVVNSLWGPVKNELEPGVTRARVTRGLQPLILVLWDWDWQGLGGDLSGLLVSLQVPVGWLIQRRGREEAGRRGAPAGYLETSNNE